MHYDPETANHLKPWLVKTLEPICDAEPGALADYILALLKHDKPEHEVRTDLISQLEEFLEKECPSFVDTLLTALRTKSYLPYSVTPSSSAGFPPPTGTSADGGIPIPLDGLLNPSSLSPERGRKRGIEQDDYDATGPSKGARLNQDGQFSRYGGRGDNRSSWGGRGERGGRMGATGRADFMDGGMVGMGGMGMNGAMNGGGIGMNGRGGHNYRSPDLRRGICRDYHNNGYCARGAFCKYSHGEDAVIPAQLLHMAGGGMPFLPMMGAAGVPFPMTAPAAGGAYDPHERMDMRPPMGGGRPPSSRPAVLPRTEDGDSGVNQNAGELPVIQDLTPQVPIQDVSPHNTGEGSRPQQRVPMEGVVPTSEVNETESASQLSAPDGNAAPLRQYTTNGRGGGGARGRGRGTFGGDAQSFRPEKRNDKTLVVEKIPQEKLTLGAVNDWFSKFGTVTNVAVDASTAKALVSFSNHEEANKAWKSEEAVFGNRFVKVFWHRPMEGHGQTGQRLLAASAPIVAQKRVGRDGSPTAPASEGSPAPQAPSSVTAAISRVSSSSSSAVALAAKQKLLEQQIAEQKSLMVLLSTASPEEKKQIMARLRKLGEEMKPSTAPSASASTSQYSPPPPPAASKRSVSAPRTEDQERIERERLDKELEMHHVETGTGDGEEESTEELKAKLEKLKAEAASLGIPVASDAPPANTTAYHRPYRGRGRGARGYYRGGARMNMKLDNRPKKLLVKGASADSLQAVRDWYETTGHVESVDRTDEGDILVSFRNRNAAEQGFTKGTHIALVGPVQVSWFTGAGTVTQGSSAAPPPSSETHKDIVLDGPVSAPLDESEDSRMHEEVEPLSWGGDDDAFGMI